MSPTLASLPIARVVVMEDRAQVERLGVVAVSGLTRVEVPSIALVAVDRSLRVEVQGATLVDAKLVRRWKEQPLGGLAADASETRKKHHALELELQAARDELSQREAKLEQLAAARADLMRAIAEQAGAGTGDPSSWKQKLDTVLLALQQADEAAFATRQRVELTVQRHQEAATALAVAEQRQRSLECVLALTLEGAGEARVKVGYLVPCAVWRPAYRATLTADTKVLVEADAIVWQRTGEAWDGVQLSLSTARPTLGTTPPTLIEDRLTTRAKQELEKRIVAVSVREEAIQTAGEDSDDEPDMPGLDDGGEARLIEAPARANVPSDGQPHRVSLFRFEAPASVERVCPAELTPLVTLVARFLNSSGQALLAGPVQVVRSSGYVGRTQLSFAAPNETVKLSFGSEDGLRVMRQSTEKTDEAMLTGRRTTVHAVKLFISNASLTPAKIIIEERVPVSEVKEVEIELIAKECKPAPAEVSKEGIARIELQLGASATQTATFGWKLSAAGKVVGM